MSSFVPDTVRIAKGYAVTAIVAIPLGIAYAAGREFGIWRANDRLPLILFLGAILLISAVIQRRLLGNDFLVFKPFARGETIRQIHVFNIHGPLVHAHNISTEGSIRIVSYTNDPTKFHAWGAGVLKLS
jgi:hypothetical protein